MGKLIVGAGYAGLSAAIALKQSDIQTTVAERESFVGLGEPENFKAIRNYGVELDFINFLKNRMVFFTIFTEGVFLSSLILGLKLFPSPGSFIVSAELIFSNTANCVF
ncbi:MAG: NAD(P)-binding protein, partial [Candidatus Thorarchaeota archaeon]